MNWWIQRSYIMGRRGSGYAGTTLATANAPISPTIAGLTSLVTRTCSGYSGAKARIDRLSRRSSSTYARSLLVMSE